MKNEILSEVWRNRDEFAKRHNYDLNAMVFTLQEMERHPLNTIVDKRKNIKLAPERKESQQTRKSAD
ncbi:MAG: hypothetical protein HQK77_21240 [Desulfobacterales bacterium]|nr:hypothetical protein [Desulfobacterales bacterium]